jgi:hypothetical protein
MERAKAQRKSQTFPMRVMFDSAAAAGRSKLSTIERKDMENEPQGGKWPIRTKTNTKPA